MTCRFVFVAFTQNPRALYVHDIIVILCLSLQYRLENTHIVVSRRTEFVIIL